MAVNFNGVRGSYYSDFNSAAPTQRKRKYDQLDELNGRVDQAAKKRKFDPLISFNQTMCALLRGALSLEEKCDKFEEHLGVIRQAGLTPDRYTYTPIISACRDEGDLERGRFYFERMKQEEGIELDVGVFNALIGCCERKGHFEEADRILVEMEAAGIKPDVKTYSALLSLRAYNGDAEGVERIVKIVHDANKKCSRAMFWILLKFYVKKQDQEKIDDVLSKMEADGLSRGEAEENILSRLYQKGSLTKVNPVAVFGREINSIVENNQLLFSQKLKLIEQQLQLIERWGLKPGLIELSPLVKLYVRQGDIEGANNVLEEMKRAGIQPSVIEYNCLIQYYSARGYKRDLDVGQFLARMKEEGISPDLRTFNALLLYCARRGDEDSADLIVQMMVDLEPTIYTFGARLSLYAKNKNEQGLDHVLGLMKLAGVEHNLSTYNILIKFYTSVGKFYEAESVLYAMRENGIKGDRITYCHFLKGYIRKRDEKNTNRFRMIMRENGFNIYEAERGLDDDDSDVDEPLELNGNESDMRVYIAPLHDFVERGDANGINEVLERINKASIKPTFQICNLLLKFHVDNGDEKGVDAVLEMMKEKEVELNLSGKFQIADLLVNKGKIDDAVRLLNTADFNDQLIKEAGLNCINLHELSHGAAYVKLFLYLTDFHPQEPFYVMTGWGRHGKQERFALRDYIINKLQCHPSFRFEVDSKNKGLIRVFPIVSGKTWEAEDLYNARLHTPSTSSVL